MKICKKCGYSISSGVFYTPDVQARHNCYHEWEEFCTHSGIKLDTKKEQPMLDLQDLLESPYKVSVKDLDDIGNYELTLLSEDKQHEIICNASHKELMQLRKNAQRIYNILVAYTS